MTSMDFVRPASCAACTGRAQVHLPVRHATHLGRLVRTLAIPYCLPCARRIRAARASRRAARWIAVVVAAAAGVLGLVAPHTSLVRVLAVTMPLACGAVLIARAVLAPRAACAPARAGRDGESVWLVRFRDFTSVLYCANPEWAATLARANRVEAVARRRRARFAPRTLRLVVVVTLVTATLAWLQRNPPNGPASRVRPLERRPPGSLSLSVYGLD